ICFFGLLISWIPPVIIAYGNLDALTGWILYALMVLLFALFPALFALLFSLVHRRSPAWSWIAAPVVWVFVEWLRNYYPMGGFPWGQLGYAMVPSLGFMQITSWTGIYGATFLVVLCN